jgi:hypothetical protein
MFNSQIKILQNNLELSNKIIEDLKLILEKYNSHVYENQVFWQNFAQEEMEDLKVINTN